LLHQGKQFLFGLRIIRKYHTFLWTKTELLDVTDGRTVYYILSCLRIIRDVTTEEGEEKRDLVPSARKYPQSNKNEGILT
jgi:hypothetical protein